MSEEKTQSSLVRYPRIQVFSVNPSDCSETEMALFILKDGKVYGKFTDRSFGMRIVSDGIILNTKNLFMEDGEEFFSSVEKALSTSSLISTRYLEANS